MITLPADILKIEGWDGTSTVTHDNGNSTTYDNLESNMTFTEHQRIVVRAAGLLKAFTEEASGWGDNEDDNAAKSAFLALKACYEDSDSPHAVYIAKGIHQRDDDPHLQLHLKASNTEKKRKFHLNVTVSRTGLDLGKDLANKFVWAPAQFVWKGTNKNYFWPKGVSTTSRKRGQSMSLSDHMAREKDIAQIRAYAKFIELLTAGHYGFVKDKDKKPLFQGQVVEVKPKTGEAKKLSYDASTAKFTCV